jgi:hypothetical protein
MEHVKNFIYIMRELSPSPTPSPSRRREGSQVAVNLARAFAFQGDWDKLCAGGWQVEHSVAPFHSDGQRAAVRQYDANDGGCVSAGSA